MKKTILIMMMIAATLTVSAQQKVALNHNGTTVIYSSSSPFVDAYDAAVKGDTIYLPGGNIPFPTTIDKGLTIIGAGHYPDSTTATNKTVLVGNIYLNQNADSLHLEGIDLTGVILFNTDNKVDNVLITRCRLAGIVYSGSGIPLCENNTIAGNVITGNLDLTNAYSSIITDNIISGIVSNGSNIGIANNIFLYNYYSYIFNNVDNSSITNNIILQNANGAAYIHNACDLSTFSYNLFFCGAPPVGNNTFENNNWYNVALGTVFVNQTGNTFSYTDDYHLVNPSGYLDAYSTQIGIYGGIFPYKEAAVPVNPHIRMKNISTQTNSSGEINVNISVGAQDN